MSLQFIADIHRVAVRLTAVLDGETDIAGSAGELFALAILCEHEQLDIAGLQAKLSVAPSTLSSIVNRLQKNELVQRQTSLRDRRTFDLVLTPPGKEKALAARSFLESLEDRMTGVLSYGQVIAFTEVVEALEKILQAPVRKAKTRKQPADRPNRRINQIKDE